MGEQRRQMSERFRLGALLAVAGGFLDAYTYLVRGGVFANAQTGNIVLLGVRLMGRDLSGALHYLIPILAFAAGVVAAEVVRARFQQAVRLHWRQITVGGEMVLLFVVAALPETLNSLANVLVSFVCAVQVESFRKFHGNSFATTMCTGNLRSGTERLFLYWKTGQRDHRTQALQYYGIILCFTAGAALGAGCSWLWGRPAVLAACVLLLAAFLMMISGKTLADREKQV